MKTLPEKFILASRSPRRVELLNRHRIAHRAYPADIEERTRLDGISPHELVVENAVSKASRVAERRSRDLVLGADTVVAVDHIVLHKPADMEEAKSMLKKLSGKTHRVYTGLALIYRHENYQCIDWVSSEVMFKELSDEVISTYFSRINPLDKAGGYAIQEEGELILDHYHGSFSNIMGLPMERLFELLQDLNLLDLFQEKTV